MDFLRITQKVSMVRNNGKGGKARRRGKNTVCDYKRPLITKEEDQLYAQVTKMLGSCRVQVECSDGKVRVGTIRGNMRKRVWIQTNDIVLVSLRGYQDDKCDVILKYSFDEAKALMGSDEIPSSFALTEVQTLDGVDIDFADTAGGDTEESVDKDFDKDFDIDEI